MKIAGIEWLITLFNLPSLAEYGIINSSHFLPSKTDFCRGTLPFPSLLRPFCFSAAQKPSKTPKFPAHGVYEIPPTKLFFAVSALSEGSLLDFSIFAPREREDEKENVSESQASDVPTAGISRPLSEILKELNRKVPDSFIKVRMEEGFSMKYVPCITYSADGKSVSVVYRVTIYGTDAEIYRESSGTASVDDTSYGDPVQKAEAMAFRRACARTDTFFVIGNQHLGVLHLDMGKVLVKYKSEVDWSLRLCSSCYRTPDSLISGRNPHEGTDIANGSPKTAMAGHENMPAEAER
ncbi:hypothetical protein ACLOJK_016899 [Asimina triloba]